jgi:replication initiation protein RepC
MTGDPRRIAPSDLPRLAPKLKHYLRSPLPAWPDIADAADRLRGDLGIPTSLWEDACVAMGREQAAVAVAVITTKEPEELGNPGGYFRGMLARHIAGELSLERTVWRLRQAIDQERYGANGSPLTAEGSIP